MIRLLGLDFAAQAKREIRADEKAVFPTRGFTTRGDIDEALTRAGVPISNHKDRYE